MGIKQVKDLILFRKGWMWAFYGPGTIWLITVSLINHSMIISIQPFQGCMVLVMIFHRFCRWLFTFKPQAYKNISFNLPVVLLSQSTWAKCPELKKSWKDSIWIALYEMQCKIKQHSKQPWSGWISGQTHLKYMIFKYQWSKIKYLSRIQFSHFGTSWNSVLKKLDAFALIIGLC